MLAVRARKSGIDREELEKDAFMFIWINLINYQQVKIIHLLKKM